MQHFQRENSVIEDYNQVLKLMRTHFLHWLEILSLIGKVSDGVRMIGTLNLTLQDKSDVPQDLVGFVYDAKRFTLSNRVIIEKAPLQIYHSALVFSPTSSVTRRQYY